MKTTQRIATLVFAALGAAALGACGEKAQTAGARKADAEAWQGAPKDPYVAPGWTAGDATSWNHQLRARAQGQNEYSRIAARPAS